MTALTIPLQPFQPFLIETGPLAKHCLWVVPLTGNPWVDHAETCAVAIALSLN